MTRRLVFFTAAAALLACASALEPSDGAANVVVGGSLVHGDNAIMNRKSHGSTENPAQSDLRWGSDAKTVSCPRRHSYHARHPRERPCSFLALPSFADDDVTTAKQQRARRRYP